MYTKMSLSLYILHKKQHIINYMTRCRIFGDDFEKYFIESIHEN